MKLHQTSPPFEEKTLLIVSGQQAAHFYLAHRRQIRSLGEFVVKNPRYSDREGYFKRSGKQMDFGSGSVYEAKKEKVHQDYLRTFEIEVKKKLLQYQVKVIYLYVPQTIAKELRARLPLGAQKLVRRTCRGNFLHLSPLELIGKINKAKTRKARRARRMLAKPEARKILRKGRSR
ncbi:MAG: hypothetical protein Q8P45_00075 [Candidatus Harrisonbacteria bacterium]|nr:hypothetical protein [Candidatus Harrisonbacteria bacterium]